MVGRRKTHLLIVLYAAWYKVTTPAMIGMNMIQVNTTLHEAGNNNVNASHYLRRPKRQAKTGRSFIAFRQITIFSCITSGQAARRAVPLESPAPQQDAPAPLCPKLGGDVKDISPGCEGEGEGAVRMGKQLVADTWAGKCVPCGGPPARLHLPLTPVASASSLRHDNHGPKHCANLSWRGLSPRGEAD